MKNSIKSGILLLLISTFSCSLNERTTPNENDSEVADSNAPQTNRNPNDNKRITSEVYFRATGTEPFWSLEISDSIIKLNTITDSIIAPYTEPMKAMDKNVKMYKIQTDSSQMNIEITQSECTNDMSGKISPYHVIVAYKRNKESATHTIEGCGAYLTEKQ